MQGFFHQYQHRFFLAKKLIRFLRNRLREVRLPQVAGSLTFTTVLALVPIFTIAFAIFTAFPIFNEFKKALEHYFSQSLFPQQISQTILDYLTQFAAKAKHLSVVGGVFLMVAAIVTMATVDRVFNDIWRVPQQRPILQRVVVYWAIISVGPLLIGISFSASSYLFSATDGWIKNSPFWGGLFFTLVSVLITMMGYTLLYMVVPNKKIDWRDAALGGLLAAVMFEIAKRLFALYIKQFPAYTVIYGALAAIPLFLLWIYFCWLITLIGALITATLPIMKFERWWHSPKPGSVFEDALAVLKVLIVARQASSSAVVDIQSIQKQTKLGIEEIHQLLGKMSGVDWVERLATEHGMRKKNMMRHLWSSRQHLSDEQWIFTANPAQIKLAQVYRLFVFDLDEDKEPDGLAKRVHQALAQGLPQSLNTYFLQNAATTAIDQPDT